MQPVQSSPVTIPELLEQIIDYLHADKAALSACALVCRAWFQLSRRTHFRVLYFATSFTAMAKAHRFAQLCTGSSVCTIPHYVRDLTIESTEVLIALMPALPMFNCITSLRLWGVIGDDAFGRKKIPLRKAFGQMRELENFHLGTCAFSDPNDVFTCISFFPALRCLSLSEVWVGTRPNAVYTAACRFRIIKVDFYVGQALELILATAPLPIGPTMTVHLNRITSSDFPSICNFLVALGSCLVHLDLSGSVPPTSDTGE